MKNKIAKTILACSLVASQMFTVFAAEVPVTSTDSAINAANGDVKISLDNKYWYKVKLPGIIELQLDGDTNSYKSDFIAQVCGEVPGKLLQINSYDFDMNSDNEKIKVSNYIGQADKGKRNHYYVVGTGDGDEPQLTKEWQNVAGLMTKKADNVKTGSYTGNANFKYKLVDPGNANNLKLNNEDVMAMAGETKNIEATYNGEDVSKVMDWTSSNENVATVVNGSLKINKVAKAGESTIITGELPEDWDEKYHSAFVDTLSKAFGPMVVQAEELSESSTSVSFEVTVVDISVKENNKDVSSVRIKPGAKTTLTAVPTPDDGNNVKWSIPELDGLTANIDGNTLELEASTKIKDGTSVNVTVSSITCTKVIPVTITAATALPDTPVKKTGTYLGMTYNIYDSDQNGTNETLVLTGKQTSSVPDCDFAQTQAPWKSGSGITNIIVDNATITNGYMMFYETNAPRSIIFNPNVDTSKCTIMSDMFKGCWSVTHIDVSHIDTSNVEKMDFMFFDCKNLKTIDVNNFNVSKVWAMTNIFNRCYSLTELYLSNWELSTMYMKNIGQSGAGTDSFTGYDTNLRSISLPKSFSTGYISNSIRVNKPIEVHRFILNNNDLSEQSYGKYNCYDQYGNRIYSTSPIANYAGQTITIRPR